METRLMVQCQLRSTGLFELPHRVSGFSAKRQSKFFFEHQNRGVRREHGDLSTVLCASASYEPLLALRFSKSAIRTGTTCTMLHNRPEPARGAVALALTDRQQEAVNRRLVAR
ncbi:unnamed protein product [Heligmosomoides polygyrus]|uniref:Uncharacterized protein n=1 Tax=Heligmosomoides polygyrus TaxID=6339 RepID=A0A183FDV0_HELPZ|nr:unnamed protein product [Heligmosomoides polygyrus]